MSRVNLMEKQGETGTSGTQMVPVAELRETILEMLKEALTELRAEVKDNTGEKQPNPKGRWPKPDAYFSFYACSGMTRGPWPPG